MNENRKRQHFRRAVMLAVVLVTLAALLGIEYSILNGNNRIQAFRTESILADQVGTILESNLQKTELLREELKENYISKAKTVAYMLEKSPELEHDVRELERTHGGYTIVEHGEVFDTLELPIMGLISDRSYSYVSKKVRRMTAKAHKMGVPKDMEPFITLSFMALPVIPEIRCTARGIFSVPEWRILVP